MDAQELIRSMPEFAALKPAEILAHPAWRMPVEWDGREAELRSDGKPSADAVSLRVSFAGTDCVLSIFAAEAFPDLSRLLPARRAVPDALMLAVVEKEAGRLLSLLEDATRMEVSVSGLCEPAAGMTAFRVVRGDGEEVRFALEVAPGPMRALGDLGFLDVAHPSVADRPLACEVEYATVELEEDELGGLAKGDCLVLPELEEERPGRLVLPGRGAAGALRVVNSQAESATVGEWLAADGDIRRERTGDGPLHLTRDGKVLAVGTASRLGDRAALVIDTVLGTPLSTSHT